MKHGVLIDSKRLEKWEEVLKEAEQKGEYNTCVAIALDFILHDINEVKVSAPDAVIPISKAHDCQKCPLATKCDGMVLPSHYYEPIRQNKKCPQITKEG